MMSTVGQEVQPRVESKGSRSLLAQSPRTRLNLRAVPDREYLQPGYWDRRGGTTKKATLTMNDALVYPRTTSLVQ